MGALAYLWRRIAGAVAGRRELEDRLDDEIRFHVEQQTEKNRRSGMAPDEARRQALIRFGGVEQMREGTRDVFRAARIEHLARDVRYGLRSLRRHPAFSAMAVLSLAIGIGANAGIFGVVHPVLFRDSPLVQPETIVNVYETEGGQGFNPPSHANIEDLRKGSTEVFSGIAVSTFAGAAIDHGGAPGYVMGEAVTGGAFALLGVEPLLGRAILPEDDIARGGHPVVMLSHGYWQRVFGADPHVVGRTLRMGGRAYTIVGVAPANYHGGLPALTPAFYVPMAMVNELMGVEMLDLREYHSFFAKARLAPGVTRAQAEYAASLVAASLSAARPKGWVPGEQFVFVPTSDVRVYPGLDSLLRAAAWLLGAVVGLVLLLACTNLASFLLARALDRGKEVAVRRALGATRVALVRQSLVESALLGLAGTAVGLILAFGLFRLLLSADLPLPFGMKLDLHLGLDSKALFDWRVLALTAGAAIAAGALLGLVPAVQGTRADLGSALNAGNRGSDTAASLKWRNALVVAQIAMSLVLLVGAGLFLRSWQQMLAVDPGFGRAPTSILSLWMPVRRSTPDDTVQLTRNVLERFRALPGIEAAGIVWPLPLEFSSSFTDFTIDGLVPPTGREAFRADRAIVDGGFFDAAGMAIVSGRAFNEADRRDTRSVAVISQAIARRYWPDADAVRRILRRPNPADDDLVIVGVASDINVRSLGEAPRRRLPGLHAGERQSHVPFRRPRCESAAPPGRARHDRTGDRSGPAGRPVHDNGAASGDVASAVADGRVHAFGVCGDGHDAGGHRCVRAGAVARRTREVGIRMALGADAAGVARLLATNSLRLVLIGGVIGVAVSLLVARVLARMLYGVETFDPVALTGAPLVRGVAAWLAAYLPARRASRVDPLAALRTE